ncbi:uncharacterized protein N7487_007507 [Penicillium crustosum]|uniref:uncharacterized protein n=1 Tax=Penicillium crustosum TaxID=36656 RepID=UPI002384D70A|nr:uncharacterized protein N7487_007507 [Penicillium crustosum]KAJ5401611.1 hypothetical protein N7487_007507 [Penicillium crustosum]
MHFSYISLAFFAIGAIAAPAAPSGPAASKPSKDFGDVAGGFPFNPTGSSSIEDNNDGFDDFPSALDAMHQALAEKQKSAEAAAHASTTHPVLAKPTSVHGAANFPDPAISQASNLPHPSPTSSRKAAPTAFPTPSHGAIPTPAKGSSASPSAIPTPTKGSSASPSEIPTPAASAAPGPLGGLVENLPVFGGLVGGPLAGLGLRR